MTLAGPSARAFLKNYSCNEPSAPLNAFLDLRGRAVAVFYTIEKSECEYLLFVSAACVEPLARHLKVYLNLTDCTLSASEGVNVFLTDKLFLPDKGSFLWLESKGIGLLAGDEPREGERLSLEDLTGIRLRAGFPIQGIDFDSTLILNLGDMNYVSLTKGCYLGQEIVARVHYRSRPPLRLEAVRESEVPQASRGEVTSFWTDPVSRERWGFWFKPTAVLS